MWKVKVLTRRECTSFEAHINIRSSHAIHDSHNTVVHSTGSRCTNGCRRCCYSLALSSAPKPSDRRWYWQQVTACRFCRRQMRERLQYGLKARRCKTSNSPAAAALACMRVLVMQAATWLVLQAYSGFHAGFDRQVAAAVRQCDAAMCNNLWGAGDCIEDCVHSMCVEQYRVLRSTVFTMDGHIRLFRILVFLSHVYTAWMACARSGTMKIKLPFPLTPGSHTRGTR